MKRKEILIIGIVIILFMLLLIFVIFPAFDDWASNLGRK